MNLLNAILYDPAGAVTKNTTAGQAMTAFDTTNLRLAITVPAHGFLRVKIMCAIHGATTYPAILLGVMDGATIRGRVAPQQSLGGTATATAFVCCYADFVIGGLTPGAMNLDAAYGVETGIASTGIKYGGANDTTVNNAFGGFSFEVWDPRPLPTAAPGAASGLHINGSNAGTTTYGALTITGATTLTGNVALADGLTIAAPSTSNRVGLSIAGNGSGAAMSLTGGATGDGARIIGGATSGIGVNITTTDGHGFASSPGGNRSAVLLTGSGTGAGMTINGGATGNGLRVAGGGTSGGGVVITTTSGDAFSAVATAGNGMTLTGNGTSKHGLVATGGTAGTSDGIKGVAGSGGVDIRGAITGNVTGNLSGSVGSVTARVTANTDQLAGQTVTAAAGVTFPTSVASPTNITAGTITTATNVTTVNGLAANVITAASMAADASAEIADAVWDEDATGHQTQGTFGQAIGDPVADANTIYGAVVTGAAGATIAADIVAVKAETADILADTAEIGAAGAGLTNINLPNQTMDIVGNITGNLSGSVGSVTGAVGSVTGNVGGNVTGSVGTVNALAANSITAASMAADASAEIADAVWDEAIAGHAGAGSTGAALSAAGAAGDPWSTALPGAYGAGTAGQIVGEFLDVAISSRLADADYTAPDNASIAAILVDTGTTLQAELDGIQADTEDIQTRLPAALVGGRIDASVGAMAANVLTAAATAADYVSEVQAGLSTLTAAQVNAEADAALADVGVTTTVTGRIDAAVSSRLASGSYTAPLDAAGIRASVGLASANLDTQIAAVKSDTAAILTDTGTTLDGKIDAIKAKTDGLNFTGSAVDVNVTAVNDIAIDGAGTAGDPWGPA
jgi:hypothetical protein